MARATGVTLTGIVVVSPPLTSSNEVEVGVVPVTMSAGIAFRGPSDTFEKLYGDADEALYEAKRKGRSQIRLSERAKDVVLSGQSAERMNLILKL